MREHYDYFDEYNDDENEYENEQEVNEDDSEEDEDRKKNYLIEGEYDPIKSYLKESINSLLPNFLSINFIQMSSLTPALTPWSGRISIYLGIYKEMQGCVAMARVESLLTPTGGHAH